MKKSKIAVLVLSLGLLMGGVTSIQTEKNCYNFDKSVLKLNQATEVVYKTIKFGSGYNDKNISSYESTWTATNDGFTCNIVNANNNNSNDWTYLRMGSKKKALVGSITNKDPIDEVITSIDITIDAVKKDAINSIKLFVSSDSGNFSETETESLSIVAGPQNVKIPSEVQGKNLYYKIQVDCKQQSNGTIQISKLTYNREKTAIDDIKAESTKAQLSYSFTKEENYNFSNMKLNFGSFIHKDKFTALTSAKSTITSYGVAIAKHSSLASTETVSSALSAKKTYVKAFEKAYDSKTFEYTDETGTSNEGDYVAFSANVVFGDKTAKYVDVYDAVAYVVVDGDYVFLQERSCSVSSLADEYIASSEFTTFSASIQASLQALGALND